MIISRVTVKGFKKHREAVWDFTPGSNMIVGPNYAGKSTVLQAILVGLWGNSAAPADTKELVNDDYKDFYIKLELSNGLVIERTSKNSSVSRNGEEPFARGHTAVNKAVAEALGISKNLHSLVFTSEQGSPQKLLDMEGAELQRFIEQVIGIDKLDGVLKAANRIVNDAKQRREAVEVFLLSPSDLEATKHSLSILDDLILTASTQQAENEQSRLHAESLLRSKTEELVEAHRVNESLRHYNSLRDSFLARLEGKSFQEPLGTQELVTQINHLMDDQKILEQRVADQRKYEMNLKKLTEDLSLVGETSFYTMEGLDESIKDLQSKIDNAKEANRMHTQLGLKAADLEKELNSCKDYLAGLGDPQLMYEEAPARAELEEASQAFTLIRKEVTDLRASLEGAACPTCKRPFEDHDPEALEVELDDALLRLKFADERLTKAKSEQARQEAHNKTELSKQEKRNSLEERIETLTEQLLANDADRFALPPAVAVEPLQKQLAELQESYSRQLKHNSRSDANQRMKQSIETSLKALVDPGHNLTQTLSDLGDIEADLTGTREALAEAKARNKLIEESNTEYARLQSGLNGLVKPEGHLIETDPLEQATQQYRKDLRAIETAISELQVVLHERALSRQPIASLIDRHQQAYDSIAAVLHRAELAQYLATLLANSREKFVSKAMATVFSIASAFAKLSTNGDIEAVLFEDGIRFVEAGRSRPKSAASGAQRSLMGLGMKLGIANLVVSDFGALLLDEATADMSEEISLACSMALSSMCEQSISVSHRKMDVAGNVIELG